MAVMAGEYHRADGQPRLRSILCTAVEVAEGVAHMHAHRIVHRDLTTRNVLLKREPAIQRTRAKVCHLCAVPPAEASAASCALEKLIKLSLTAVTELSKTVTEVAQILGRSSALV